MAVRFVLHKRSGTGLATLATVQVAVNRRGGQLKVGTLVRARPRDWSRARGRLKPAAEGAATINGELERLRVDVEALTLAHADDRTLKEAILERVGRKPVEHGPSLMALLDAFVAEKRVRTRRGTVQVYQSLAGHLSDHLPEGFGPGDIDAGFVDDFATHLLGRGLANSTVNKLSTRLSGFLRWLKKRGHITDVPEARALPTVRNQVVYLTTEELERFMAFDLEGAPPGMQAARDLFVFSACTGQRISDLLGLRWSHIDLGTWWWTLPVQKTGRTTRVPIAGPARAILERRAGSERPLPEISGQRANDYIKVIARRAGICPPVTLVEARGSERTHTSRWHHRAQ